MITGFDDRELVQLIKDTSIAERGAGMFARKVIKNASISLEKRVKSHPPKGMPVRTGRARASWGHWKGAIKPGSENVEGGPIWREEDGGLSIEQGSNVEYIEHLNSGSSRQSPAGFIDMAFMIAEIQLQVALGGFDPLEAQANIAQVDLIFEGA